MFEPGRPIPVIIADLLGVLFVLLGAAGLVVAAASYQPPGVAVVVTLGVCLVFGLEAGGRVHYDESVAGGSPDGGGLLGTGRVGSSPVAGNLVLSGYLFATAGIALQEPQSAVVVGFVAVLVAVYLVQFVRLRRTAPA